MKLLVAHMYTSYSQGTVSQVWRKNRNLLKMKNSENIV